MFFNSIEFAVFLPIVFLLYWFVVNGTIKSQNVLLLIASYIFYGWWDWRFLGLIILSSIIDYKIGLSIHSTNDQSKRKKLLYLSLFVNLGFLGFFKYYNFFIDSFSQAFSFFGQDINPDRLSIILPVGISFYTFQTLSYTIDVYRRKLEPSKDIVAFFTFVSFFPQLVAGPIERATNLLPQFFRKRNFNYLTAVDGIQQILWGFFKKIVIADNCAEYVAIIFNNHTDYSGSTLVLGAVLFAFQIYGDFSGYSDIAIGTSKLFGFKLKQNFAFPYFSRDIAEFWRRWHISLSTWFRDYLYIPLGGSKGSLNKKIRNIFIIFIVSGFWHGANWTFIIWGALNAIYFLPLLVFKLNRKNIDFESNSFIPSLADFLKISITFILTCFAWIFFRADSVEHAFSFINHIFNETLFQIPQIIPKKLLILILIFNCIEWLGKKEEYAIYSMISWKNRFVKYSVYFALILFIISFGFFGENQFIYFQF